MERLLRLRIGGGRVHPGMLPVASGLLVRDLIIALRDHGGAPEAWDHANLHVAVLGEASTAADVYSDFVPVLQPAVHLFGERAAARSLSGNSRAFVEKHFRPSAPWAYLEIVPENGSGDVLRFDYEYLVELQERQPQSVTGEEVFYAAVERVGGSNPPTVKLDLPGYGSRTVQLKGDRKHAIELAKFLGKKLYETVKVHGLATWDKATLELLDFEPEGVDKAWEDVHLLDVIEENGGKLPADLSVEDVAEIERERLLGWRD